MANITIPCLVAKRNVAGVVTSWHWQPSKTLRDAGWSALALGRDQSAAIDAARKRNAEVQAWKQACPGEGRRPAPPGVQKRTATGTLAALITRYRKDVLDNDARDNGRAPIAATTRKVYNTSLHRLQAWAGDQPLAYVTPARVRALRNAMMKPAEQGGLGHHPAHATLKMGRTLFRFAESIDLIPRGANPFDRFDLAAPAPRDVVWSPPAREAMIAAAIDQGQPSMALAIMLGFAIGQREADLLALTARHYVRLPEHKVLPEHYRILADLAPDNVPMAIRVRQQKTKAWIEVAVVGTVRTLLEHNLERAAQLGSTTILLDDTRPDLRTYAGKAGQTRFQRDFAEIREWAAAIALADDDEQLAADLATLHFADLRRTCVVYLGELGFDAHQIAAITGHDIDEAQKILATYMPRTTGRAASTIALAAAREAREAKHAAEREERSA